MSGTDPNETFRQEARELLEQIEEGLLDLEQNPADADLVNSVFRALHTIKGSGAMFGFTAVAEFVHEFETAFDRVRKGKSVVSPELIRVALDARDHIHRLIEDPGATGTGGEAILASLQAVVAADAGVPAAAASPSVAARPEASETAGAEADRVEAAGDETGRWRVRFSLPADALVYGTNPALLLEEIAAIGPMTVTALTDGVPPLEAIDPEQCHLGWQVDLEAADPREAIDDVFLFLRDGMDLSVTPLAGEAPAPAATPAPAPATPAAEKAAAELPASEPEMPAKPAEPAKKSPAEARAPRPAASADKAGSSLRVAAERLDELMDRVGELVIAQARLTQIAGSSADPALKTIAEELERLSSGLRDTTMGIRMVPIGSLFGRFRRLVHDLSRDLGKDIEFITSGEETELDKTMIERLADPLVHLIRNSVDHGLEDAERRRAAGKPKAGTVRLSAVYAGAEVAISVSDDGAGLDAARIRAKAEEAGLLMPDAKIAEQDLYQMIFAPGFSTASTVTSLSGRGVGMDVVKRTIEGLRGTIELSTVPGQGTTMTLRLPLTLAIIDGMLVRVGDGRYSIPLAAVEECVELPATADAGSNGRSFLDIRGALVPFIRLREQFKCRQPADAHQKVVIVSSGEGRVGLVVDQIIGNTQTVIKQLSPLHAGMKSFSGATILGDGTVALILDAAHLVGTGHAPDDAFMAEVAGRAA